MNDILGSIPDVWKNRFIIFLLGSVLGIGSAGWSGLFRIDPFTGDDGKKLALRITELERTTYNKDQIRERLAGYSAKFDANETALKEIRADLRAVHSRLDKLPPRELTDRVARLEAMLEHIQYEHEKLFYTVNPNHQRRQ